MILAIDLMGGDLGPQATSQALIHAAIQHPGITFYAIGQAHVLSQYFSTKPDNIALKPVDQVVTMEMSVTEATRLGERSSMGAAIAMVKRQEADACLSCGNTAGLMAMSYFMLKTMEGIRRPAILSSIVQGSHRTYVADIGANILPKAQDFYDNARLASAMCPKENPKIALLNVGAEEEKGTPLIKEASELLKASDLHYIGYMEGHDILKKKTDILLMDGFVGNCMTKFMEGLLTLVRPLVTDTATLPRFHYAALLAGLNGLVYKAHGNSNKEAYQLAIQDIITTHAKSTV